MENKSQSSAVFIASIITALTVAGLVIAPPLVQDHTVSAIVLPRSFSGGELPITKFTATNAYEVMGKTRKGGMDLFTYDGSGHMRLKSGEIHIDLNPVTQTGQIDATWVDSNNTQWRFTQTKFTKGAELYFDGIYPNGTAKLRIGSDSIAINHWEHGNTGGGPPVLPTVFVYLASWGPAQMWKNGKLLGTFSAHMMVTDGVRNPITGKVLNAAGTAPYNPMTPADGSSNRNAAQVHLIILPSGGGMSMGGMTNSGGGMANMFANHLMFYDITAQ
jgi:hypothetical protein